MTSADEQLLMLRSERAGTAKKGTLGEPALTAVRLGSGSLLMALCRQFVLDDGAAFILGRDPAGGLVVAALPLPAGRPASRG